VHNSTLLLDCPKHGMPWTRLAANMRISHTIANTIAIMGDPAIAIMGDPDCPGEQVYLRIGS